MKRFISLFALMLLSAAFALSQTVVDFPKSYNGDYNTLTISAGKHVLTADTSYVYKLPTTSTSMTIYFSADTVTGGSGTKIYVDASPNGQTWFPTTALLDSTASLSAAGSTKKTITLYDNFVRFRTVSTATPTKAYVRSWVVLKTK